MQRNVMYPVLAALFLSACGGGGGGSGVIAPSDPLNPGGDAVLDPGTGDGGTGGTGGTGGSDGGGYSNARWNILAVGADKAWAQGYTGEGVTVAVVDTGANVEHESFTDRIVDTYSFEDGGTDVPDISTPGKDQGHGTHVAGIVGGSLASGFGVAPGVNLMIVKTIFDGANTAVVADGILYAIKNGAKVVNLSQIMGNAVFGADAMDLVINNDALIVTGAGNDGLAEPRGLAYPGSLLSESIPYQDYVVAVGSVNRSNEISDFSNRAGRSKNNYLVAPGENIASASYTSNTGVRTLSGTSMATPHVSGAAALIRGRWPELTATEVMQILFESATDLGDPGVDDIYGWGLLNIEAAMNPVGKATISSLGGGSADLRQSHAVTGSAFGDALGDVAALEQVLVTDKFRRDFQADVSASLRPARRVRFDERLINWTAPRGLESGAMEGGRFQAVYNPNRYDAILGGYDYAGFDARVGKARVQAFGFKGDAGLTLGDGTRLPVSLLSGGGHGDYFLSLARQGGGTRFEYPLGAGLTTRSAVFRGQDAALNPITLARAGVAWQGPGWTLGLGAGQLDERGLFGSRSAGALALGLPRTTTLDLDATVRLASGVLLFGRYQHGITRIKAAANSLLTGFGPVQSRTYAVGLLVRPDERALIGAVAASPLKVVGGTARVNAPVALDAQGEPVFRGDTVGLAPSGTQRDFELFYALTDRQGRRWRANLLYQVEPGHVASARAEAGASVMVEVPF